jgi:hypothetical protein
MADNSLEQKRYELVSFKTTALYQDMVGRLADNRKVLWRQLLVAALRSSDQSVRRPAEGLIADSTIERMFKEIEAPDGVIMSSRGTVEDKEFDDYPDVDDITVVTNMEYV